MSDLNSLFDEQDLVHGLEQVAVLLSMFSIFRMLLFIRQLLMCDDDF